jgi:hypothetical protein
VAIPNLDVDIQQKNTKFIEIKKNNLPDILSKSLGYQNYNDINSQDSAFSSRHVIPLI